MAIIPTTVVGLRNRLIANIPPPDGSFLQWNQSENGGLGHWRPGSPAVSGAGVHIGPAAPPNAALGDMWLNITSGALSIYDGSNWRPTGITVANNPPAFPTVGTGWYNPNTTELGIWDGGGWEPVGIPESPANPNAVFGRGQLPAHPGERWHTVLPLAGGKTMEGNLYLNGPPGPASPLNQAATKGYVGDYITGALHFIGTYNARDNIATHTESSGFAARNTIVPAAEAPDAYLIVAISGTVPAGAYPFGGMTLLPLEWLISDGQVWTEIQHDEIHWLASEINLAPPVFGQTDVQGALAYIEQEGIAAQVLTGAGQPANPRDGMLWFNGIELRVYYAGEWKPTTVVTLTGDVENAAP